MGGEVEIGEDESCPARASGASCRASRDGTVEFPGSGVAVCFFGQVRMLQVTAAAIEQNVLAVLRPEVFIYGPRRAPDEGEPELYELGKYVVASRWETENIRWRLYNETRNARQTILDYFEVQGNWISNACLTTRPLRDKRPGS